MSWRRRSVRDRDRDEEFAAHLAEAIDHYKAQGLDEEEAALQRKGYLDALGAFPLVVTLDNHYLEFGQGVMVGAAMARAGPIRS